MQEEIHRIRNKDYSQLDQKLFSNLGMTSQLDNTLSQLAELQKYLKCQIDSISDKSQKQAAVIASRVVLMNSLPQQDKQIKRCKCHQIVKSTYQKVIRMKKSYKYMKDLFSKQFADCLNDFKEIVQQNLAYIINVANRKQNQHLKYKTQIFQLQQEINKLKNENSQLLFRLEEWQVAKKRTKQRITQKFDRQQGSTLSIYMNTQNQLSAREDYGIFENQFNGNVNFTFAKNNNNRKHCTSLNTLIDDNQDNQIPKLPMPLRREFSSNNISRQNSVDRYSSCQQGREITSQKGRFLTAKSSPITQKVSTFGNHRQKQNQLLKMKGADHKQPRKSTKKLKLFSLL